MPTSTSSVFCRVNRRRPCRICGKPDWRSYVRCDGERISICMRVSDGARKINCHGGAIFIHDEWREEKGNGSGRIQTCQTRLPFAEKKGLRYLWFSSDLPHGTGSGSPLHFKFHLADLPLDARIVIVEGVLKADVLFAVRPELYIVATPCVTTNHASLVELTRGRLAWIGFDQDHYSNETVCFHLASLIARRLRCERTLATTRIASWDAHVKGIDDAAASNLPITSISVRHWLDRLSPQFRRIAMARLSEIAAVPIRAKNGSGSQWQ